MHNASRHFCFSLQRCYLGGVRVVILHISSQVHHCWCKLIRLWWKIPFISLRQVISELQASLDQPRLHPVSSCLQAGEKCLGGVVEQLYLMPTQFNALHMTYLQSDRQEVAPWNNVNKKILRNFLQLEMQQGYSKDTHHYREGHHVHLLIKSKKNWVRVASASSEKHVSFTNSFQCSNAS